MGSLRGLFIFPVVSHLSDKSIWQNGILVIKVSRFFLIYVFANFIYSLYMISDKEDLRISVKRVKDLPPSTCNHGKNFKES